MPQAKISNQPSPKALLNNGLVVVGDYCNVLRSDKHSPKLKSMKNTRGGGGRS